VTERRFGPCFHFRAICAADDFLNCEEKFVDKLHANFEKRDGYCRNTSLHIRVCAQWRFAGGIHVAAFSRMKLRLDKLLLERGLASSREHAQALILAGRVLVNEQKVAKPGTSIATDAGVRVLGDEPRYVSRGGLKLERALAHWKIDLRDKVCLDV